jgi:IclR family transcriptional regulator, acetate operon repressor
VNITADEASLGEEAGKIRGAETARRTVRLLAALAARQPALLDELCAAVGLNKNTTYRLLRVLQEEGYAERLPRGGYRLGPAVAELVRGIPASPDLVEAARPSLRELAEITGETAALHRRAGDTVMMCVGVESEQHSLRYVIRDGDSDSLVSCSAGNAILAFAGEPDRAAVIARGGLRPAQRRALERHLDEVAGRGYVASPGTHHAGLFVVAAPVLPADGEPPGFSVSVSGPEHRWTEQAAAGHVDALLRCCGRISGLMSG